MNKGVALCLIVPLLAIVSSVEVMAGATISDRRYRPNEARGSPDQAIEISPPYIYPAPPLEPLQPRIGPRRKAVKIDRNRSDRLVWEGRTLRPGAICYLLELLAIGGGLTEAIY